MSEEKIKKEKEFLLKLKDDIESILANAKGIMTIKEYEAVHLKLNDQMIKLELYGKEIQSEEGKQFYYELIDQTKSVFSQLERFKVILIEKEIIDNHLNTYNKYYSEFTSVQYKLNKTDLSDFLAKWTSLSNDILKNMQHVSKEARKILENINIEINKIIDFIGKYNMFNH